MFEKLEKVTFKGLIFLSLKYYQPVICDGLTASCDSVILDGKLSHNSDNRVPNYISLMDCGIKIDYWQSFKFACYRHQWTITFLSGCSCTLQLSFNDGKKPNSNFRLDYNPNKCNYDKHFIKLHNFIISESKFLDLKRWDFALDYPVERENCFLIKDQRKYREEKYSNSDKTQYLGIRSHGGFIKLYNKQIESKLDTPLTRLELTIDGLSSYDALSIPLVYFLETSQMRFDELSLTDTDRFILNALLKDMDSINMLGRKKRDKMQKIIDSYTRTLNVDRDTYYRVLDVARAQCKQLSMENIVDEPYWVYGLASNETRKVFGDD